MTGSYYGAAYDQAAVNGGTGAYFETRAPAIQREPGSAVGTTSTGAMASTVGALWLISRGVGGYLVGRAVAPTQSARGTYGWVGALVGTFMGPIGLGIMSVVAMEDR